MKNLKRWQFYLLSFTWGLPMSLIGLVVCGVLMCFGYKPQRFGHCYYITIGTGWGGVDLGWLFLCSDLGNKSTMKHELGHAYQNACILGWIFPIYGLMSMARYWYDRLIRPIDYYSWWFEGQATKIGKEVIGDDV